MELPIAASTTDGHMSKKPCTFSPVEPLNDFLWPLYKESRVAGLLTRTPYNAAPKACILRQGPGRSFSTHLTWTVTESSHPNDLIGLPNSRGRVLDLIFQRRSIREFADMV